MFITRTSLPRRTFLRGAGTMLALPLLDAMVPAVSAMTTTAAGPVKRLGFFYVPNGVTLPDWTPKALGTKFEISPILSPLAPFKEQLVVVSGLTNAQADVGGPNGAHIKAHAVWLNGVAPQLTDGSDVRAGTTIDQLAAQKLGKDTPLTSLELALEPNYIVGNCDNGYSCVYQNTFSWRTPTTPLPMENNPRAVFERLFGDGGSGAERLARMRKDRSILDAVTAEITRLLRTLGPGDRLAANEYLDALREVERRIQKAERRTDVSSESTFSRPLGIPDSDDEHAKLMLDLAFLAYQADITRVVTFQIGREQSQRTYPELGVAEGHHNVSHHGHKPDRMQMNSVINKYHVGLFAYFVDKLRSAPDADGSLLDHAMLLYGGGLGDGDLHLHYDLPIVLVGGGCGSLKGGRHIKAPADTPLMNVGLSLLDKVGVELDRVGDSTGRLVDL